jgi:hypothetical protein
MAKGRTYTGTPHTHARITNRDGFSKGEKLGSDTVPGKLTGAPLATSRCIDDGTVKETRYEDGIYPGSMSAIVSPGTLGNLDKDAPAKDSPSRGQRPHPDLDTKSSESAFAENTIGDEPTGVLAG